MSPELPPRIDPLDDSRMTVGEHLDELRSCVIRSVMALAIAIVALIWPAKYLLEWIARPVILVLQQHGQPDNLLQTSPTELVTIYLKVVLIAAIIIASPYIIREFWRFVGAGLYPHEKKWVGKLVPFSVGLFLLGVGFMYSLVLIASLNFLVWLPSWFPLPEPKPTAIERAIMGVSKPVVDANKPSVADTPRYPVFGEDPADPPTGAMWINETERKLKVRATERTLYLNLHADERRPLTTTYFKIGDYLTFVLTMTIAFGLAFQVPLVVMALARIGIVTLDQFRKGRKYVVVGILVLAGILAPPEIVSHMLLSVPMILLFEFGLYLAARAERKRISAQR